MREARKSAANSRSEVLEREERTEETKEGRATSEQRRKVINELISPNDDDGGDTKQEVERKVNT